MAPCSELRPIGRPWEHGKGSPQMVPESTRNMSRKWTSTSFRVQRHSARGRLRDEIRSAFRYFSHPLYKANISRVLHKESDHDPTLSRLFSPHPRPRGRWPLGL